jgi:hypothetical protein
MSAAAARSTTCARGLARSVVAARRGLASPAQAPARRRLARAATAAAAAAGTTATTADAAAPSSQSIPRDKFDLPTAVALAAAAFEAYLEPRGCAWRSGREQRWAPLKTPAPEGGGPAVGAAPAEGESTTYTNAAFLRAAYAGVLEFRILSASGLKAVNALGGGSDPFAVATLPGEGGRCATPVAWGTCDPQWAAAAVAGGGGGDGDAAAAAAASAAQQTHTLYVRDDPRAGPPSDPEMAAVRVEVFDRANVLGSDEPLGMAAVAVSDFVSSAAASALPSFVRRELPLRGRNAQGAVVVEGRFLPFSRGDSNPEPGCVSADDYVAADGPAVPEPAPQPEVSAAGADLAAAAAAAAQSAAAGATAAAASAAEGAIKEAQGLMVGDKKAAGEGGKAKGLFAGAAAMLASARRSLSKTRREAEEVKAAAEAPPAAAAPAAPAPPPPPAPPADAEALEKARHEQQQLADAWRAVTKAAGRVMHASGDRTASEVGADFAAVAFIESHSSGTECWVARSLSAREVVVAFRGTEQTSLKDVLSDLNAVPTAFEEEWRLTDEERGGTGGGEGEEEVYVHRGFLQAWDSVRPRVLAAVAAAIATAPASGGDGGSGNGGNGGQSSQNAPWMVYVTGHSLGGACATAAAFDLAHPNPRIALPGLAAAVAAAGGAGASSSSSPPPFDVCYYSYGAPRVGNAAFARAFAARMEGAAQRAAERGGNGKTNLQAAGASFRILNQRDLVPCVPRMIGLTSYVHVPYGVRLPAAAESDAEGREAREQATEAAAAAVAGALQEEEEGGQKAAPSSSSADDPADKARRALDALEQFLVFEDADGLDARGGDARDIAAVVADAASSAASALQSSDSVLDGLSAAAGAAATAVGGAKLLEGEMDLVSSLMDGTAVTDHLEPSYLGRLVAAMRAGGIEVPEALLELANGGGGGGEGEGGGAASYGSQAKKA